MKYRVYDIQYDTDNKTVELQSEILITLDEAADPSLELADEISNQTGWCVEAFQFESVAIGQQAKC